MSTLRTTLILSTIATLPLSAINITIDYSYTTDSFFDNSPNGILAKSAVNAAALDISNAITSHLGAINTYNFNGSSDGGTTTTSFTATLEFNNPDTGIATPFTDALAADQFIIFAGARPLGGATLGQGGPGATGYSGGGGGGFESEWIATVADAETKFNNTMNRGTAVLASSFSGNSTLGSTTANYALNLAPTIGNLWFDNDGSGTWHYNHLTSVNSGESDLYSVALHEILHSLGFGISDSWKSFRSGTDWSGAEAIAENGGSGTGLVESGSGHISTGTMSTRITDGSAQEAAMDPSILTGTRKSLTELDLAFLRDLGYETVPEPSTAALLAFGLIAILRRRR